MNFDLDLCMCIGYDHTSLGIESQGHMSRLKSRVTVSKDSNAVGSSSILDWRHFCIVCLLVYVSCVCSVDQFHQAMADSSTVEFVYFPDSVPPQTGSKHDDVIGGRATQLRASWAVSQRYP